MDHTHTSSSNCTVASLEPIENTFQLLLFTGRCLATAVVLLLVSCHCPVAGLYFTIRTVFLNFTDNYLSNFDMLYLLMDDICFGNVITFLCNLYINKLMILYSS